MGKNKKRNKSKSNAKARASSSAPNPVAVDAPPATEAPVDETTTVTSTSDDTAAVVEKPKDAELAAAEVPASEVKTSTADSSDPAADSSTPAPEVSTPTPAPESYSFTHAKSYLSPAAYDLACKLQADNQGHLFSHWVEGSDDDKKTAMMDQLLKLHESYPLPDGLLSYTANARSLLAISKEGKNPLAGWVPSVPQGEVLEVGTPSYDAMEKSGLPLLASTGFVLVAGGLGERLGYGGIKVGLPTETCTETCYLQYYIETILAIQAKYGEKGRNLELAIMVSDDTHDKTVELLEDNAYFGMNKANLTLMKQEKVAAIASNEGAIAQDSSDLWSIDSKPHGHGDVHSLMHSKGVAQKWTDAGFTHVVFFQDTNGLGFHTLAASLGVSKTLGLVMNSLAIPRKAKQAVGAVCKLENKDTSEVRTINVEYNQLDPLLRDTVSKDGDVNDEKTGFSPYPGNINQLIFSLKEYNDNLKLTSGVMAEFVNPKYADSEKTVFKKPTRLECMMQDYPMVLKGDDAKKVGFTSVAADMCFSPVKNATSDGVAKQQSGTHPAVAFSGESDQYNAVAKIMRSIGCNLEDGEVKEFLGIKMPAGPKVVISPFVCPQPADYKAAFPSPGDVTISGKSVLIIEGKGSVVIKSLKLDGTLVIEADEAKGELVVDGLDVVNEGWTEKESKGDAPEWTKMRGYTMEKKQTCTFGHNGLKGDFKEVEKEAEKKVEEPVKEAAKEPVKTDEIAKTEEVKVEGVEIGSGEATDCGCVVC